MRELSKLLNQTLCFGNLLTLIRECGGRVKPCGGRVLACETHLCHIDKAVKHLPSMRSEDCETTKTSPSCPLTHFRDLSGSYDTGT